MDFSSPLQYTIYPWEGKSAGGAATRMRRPPDCIGVARPKTSKPSAKQDALKGRRTCLPKN